MKTEEKVITFEQAKKLKELGFDKKSQYGWLVGAGKPVLTEMESSLCYYPAYDTSEMLEITKEHSIAPHWDADDNIWLMRFIESPGRMYEETDAYDTQAEALGELLIYLVENNKI